MEFEQQLQTYLQKYDSAPGDMILASRMLVRSAHIVENRLNTILQPLSITIQEYLALLLISSTPGPIRPTEISETLGISRPQVTRLLDSLEKRGDITRQKSPKDRRALLLNLTPKGKEVFNNSTVAVHKAYKICWQNSEKTIHDLLPALRQMYLILREGEDNADQATKK